MVTEFLFVYGTLRGKAMTPMSLALARDCRYHGDGYIRGRLYEVAGYPAAVESDALEEKVYGELYRLTDACSALSRLDDYEECSAKFPLPHEYVRKQLRVVLNNNDTVMAWCYLYQRDVSRLKRILSGDYLEAGSA